MLRSLIIYIGRKKNPAFDIAGNISSAVLAGYIFSKSIEWLRHLRIILYFKKPGLIFFGSNVSLSGTAQLRFGRMVQIGRNTIVSAYGRKGMRIGNSVWIGGNSVLRVSFSFNDPGDFIYIGNNVGIGEFAHLGGAGGLTIGNDCIIGPYFSCHPENHNYASEELIRHQGVTRKGITIGNNCWIGAKVTVLDGVTIGDNCVIAAGAVVRSDIPSGSVAAGVPAKVIRSKYQQELKVA
jgi:acetyltransferase-like isoleucine patch superfamily enzyme